MITLKNSSVRKLDYNDFENIHIKEHRAGRFKIWFKEVYMKNENHKNNATEYEIL